MVILGIGTNLGDRLQHLRRALFSIRNISGVEVLQVSPLYISDAMLPENAPPAWNLTYINLAISCKTTLPPLVLLKKLKAIETDIGRKQATHWAPRIVDIDILAWNNEIVSTPELSIPHLGLLERPFALWPLADVAPFWQYPLPGVHLGKTAAELIEPWGSRFLGECPLHTRQINQRIDTPELVGVINITPDSFSDGGKYINQDAAIERAKHLVNAGASILDIGAESTAPHAMPIHADEEWLRLEPILAAITNEMKNNFLLPKISIDTRHAAVARSALAYHIDWINDVSGLQDPTMIKLVGEKQLDCVVMHHVSIPASKNHVLPRNIDVVKYVYQWADTHFSQLEQLGINRDHIIFDPGIGFGKTPEQSLALIKGIAEFKKLGVRILVGHSRKLFLTTFTQLPSSERDIETLACSLFMTNQSVDFLRVHNVEMCARGIRVQQALAC